MLKCGRISIKIIKAIASYGDIQDYTDIYFPSASRMQYLGRQEYSSWASRYGAGHIFSDIKQKHVWWVFGCVAGVCLFNVQ